ncbi:hypothetical protein NQ315_002388 [Exocentrus adspersus]|uniref:Peroxin-19 n=1 Tax=Exocentrus adspersus TaxID=1586481 RepID=A0AAV8VT09_9CUCU|nr:hypothetical protein NQ315_002388 [Exocentrus adspersus]
MSADKKDAPKSDQVDDELSELLDSALEDFKKSDEAKKDDAKPDGTSSAAVVSNTNDAPVDAEEWSADFIQRTASQFEQNFASLLAGSDANVQLTPEFVQQKLQQMADAAQQVLENPAQVTDNSADFASSITQAIQGLNAGAEGLQAPMNEEDLMKIFGPGGSLGQENELLPFMQGMMQGLLSKEVLGPSLQDFVEKLPDYIEKNRATLAKEDIERYENQKKLMEEVLEELNKEQDSDSAEVKKDRFSKVLALMQKLQDYGQPPSELVGDVETPFNFDPQGNPVGLPNNTDVNPDCSIM